MTVLDSLVHPLAAWKSRAERNNVAFAKPHAEGDHTLVTDAPRVVKREAKVRSPESQQLSENLKALGAGQHAALAKCYDLMGPVVFSLAVRMLRDRAAAEDVTQDVFVQVWRQAANYDTTRGSPETWMMMIARTRVLDRLRSRSAGVVLKPAGDHLPDAPDADDWPDDLAINHEQAVCVREALDLLPTDQRQAIELAFFEGLTHVQIADHLGVPLGTIKTRIRLGLIRIKDKLRDVLGESSAQKENVL